MTNDFKCPHCGKKIEITEALRHQVETDVKKNLEKKLRSELAEESGIKLKELQKQLEEREEKLSLMRDAELKLRQEKRKLEDKEKELELEVERKIDEEKKKIEEKVMNRAVEEHRMKDLEKEKKISDLQKQLEDALRKAKVGSQQMQGEILELDLEESLTKTFPNDEIEPVGKGVKGADVRQIVKSPKGFICGVILWETKRTKNWTEGWVSKLKSDLRAEKANIPVIVSEALPDEAKPGFGLKDGVWIVSFNLVLPIASVLRKNLLDIGFQKAVSAHKGEKADYLYEYVTSHEFRQQLEALVEVYNEMQTELSKEKVAFERTWKSREGQIERLITSTANVVGSIQGRVGSSALQIKGLEFNELEDGNKKK